MNLYSTAASCLKKVSRIFMIVVMPISASMQVVLFSQFGQVVSFKFSLLNHVG
jgi:hypothetical protein